MLTIKPDLRSFIAQYFTTAACRQCCVCKRPRTIDQLAADLDSGNAAFIEGVAFVICVPGCLEKYEEGLE
jgi:hypothetical protein